MDEPLPDMPPDMWEPPAEFPVRDVTPPPAVREAPKEGPAPVQKATSPAAIPAPARKSDTLKPTTATSPNTPSIGGQRVLRPLRVWTEAVERVKATSRMAASFLISAKAYTTEDSKVVVKLDSSFARDMVSRESAPEALRAALSVCLGRKLEITDILYEVEDTRVRTNSDLIDLIVEAAEE